nr:hypothetical protein [Tessaracoccus coleopterorum]
MAESSRSANAYERGVVDLAEALVLSTRVGEVFDGVITDVNPKNGAGTVQIADPAVELRVEAGPRTSARRSGSGSTPSIWLRAGPRSRGPTDRSEAGRRVPRGVRWCRADRE